MKKEKSLNKASRLLICFVLMAFLAIINTSCGKDNPSNEPIESQTESRSDSSKDDSVDIETTSGLTSDSKETVESEVVSKPESATAKPATPKPATPKPIKGVEKFVSSPNNDTSTMYSRDERVFSFLAYPSGRTEDDFTIDYNWENYISVSDVKLDDMGDATKISFKVKVDQSILQKSSDTLGMISLKSTSGTVSSDAIKFKLAGVEISDAEPLTIRVNEPQVATFKVIPASLPLEMLEPRMNAYVYNLEAEIIDSDIDAENNCQYVHVQIRAISKSQGTSSGYFDLQDIYHIHGGTCDLTIIE